MKIFLKEYQERAVKSLTDHVYSFLRNTSSGTKTAVLQAPTGSGKTIMMSSVIESLIEQNKEKTDPLDITFIWLSIGKGDLHNQSKRSLEKVFNGYPFIQSIDSIYGTSQRELLKDSVIVINWEKIRSRDSKTQEWKNIVMKDGDYTNFREILNYTNSINRKIILIIDESHTNTNAERGREIIELINPSVTIEVSATPVLKITGEDVINNNGWIEKINPQDVIDQEMIKDQILVNFDFEIRESDDSDQAILRTAIQKRDDLAKMYKENNIPVNPLLMVQLPNSAQGETVKTMVLEHLKNTRGVSIGDERLAIWLDSEDQKYRNLTGISDNTAPQEYLIFKQAVDTGWDCPRAQILLKFRESDSETFNIQVLGRILRMPEQRHYENELLNKAYVYTQTLSAQFDIEQFNPKILGDQPMKREPTYNPIKLISFYRERADYQDIKSDFKKVLLDTMSKKLGLTLGDHLNNIKKLKSAKITTTDDLGWQFDTQNILYSVIKDLVLDIKTVDDYVNIFTDDDNELQTLVLSERQIEFTAKNFLRSVMAPFTNIARSVPAMNSAWFLVCRELFGETLISEGSMSTQAFLLLNEKKLKPIFIESVLEYSKVRSQKAKEDTEHFYDFEITERDYVNKENSEKCAYERCIMQPCWLDKNRSKPEQMFEKYLEESTNIDWWYKNGESRRDYFGIRYEYQGEVATFYPDYIVQCTDGRIAIFETKDENDQDAETKTKAKNIALQEYIQEQNKDRKKNKLIGGIVIWQNAEWKIKTTEEFDNLEKYL